MNDIIKAINTGNWGLVFALIVGFMFVWMFFKVIEMDKANGIITSQFSGLKEWMQSLDDKFDRVDEKVDRAIERREHPRN